LVKEGVIDPAKVTRIALQNAASIAGLMLTTEALIAEIPEKEKAPAGPHAGEMGAGCTSSPVQALPENTLQGRLKFERPFFMAESHLSPAGLLVICAEDLSVPICTAATALNGPPGSAPHCMASARCKKRRIGRPCLSLGTPVFWTVRAGWKRP
jgi:hypothetical protein